MRDQYYPQELEPKWQTIWEKTNPNLPAYPSEKPHVEHIRKRTIGDVMARFKQMQECNASHPFDLPAEIHKPHQTKNTIDPNQLVATYGTEAVRLFLIFAAPPEKNLDWSDRGVEGCYRFLSRAWRLVAAHQTLLKTTATAMDIQRPLPLPEIPEALRPLYRSTHKLLKKTHDDIVIRMHFNTAISSTMKHLNLIGDAVQTHITLIAADTNAKRVFALAVVTMLRALFPFAPYFASECWTELGLDMHDLANRYPEIDPNALLEETFTCVVQVNGRLRARLEMARARSKEEIEKAALADARVQKWIAGRPVSNVIVVPQKLVNIVV